MWEWIVEQSVNKAPIVALVEFVLLTVGSFVAWWRHESIKAEFRKQVERLKQYMRDRLDKPVEEQRRIVEEAGNVGPTVRANLFGPLKISASAGVPSFRADLRDPKAKVPDYDQDKVDTAKAIASMGVKYIVPQHSGDSDHGVSELPGLRADRRARLE